MTTAEKCDAWLQAGAMGRLHSAFCERAKGHEIDEDHPELSAHHGGSAYWIDEAEYAGRGPLPIDPKLTKLRDLITSTADTYAADHDHVVVLDDVVAEAIAAKVWDAYIGGGS